MSASTCYSTPRRGAAKTAGRAAEQPQRRIWLDHVPLRQRPRADFGTDLMETIPYTNYWDYPAMPISGFLIMIFAFKHIVDECIRSPDSSTVESP